MIRLNLQNLWRLFTPKIEDREFKILNGMKLTGNDYAQSLFEIILNKLKDAKEFHLVNDRYDLVHTLKDAEHQRRSQHQVSVTKNVYIKAHEMLPSKQNFIIF